MVRTPPLITNATVSVAHQDGTPGPQNITVHITPAGKPTFTARGDVWETAILFAFEDDVRPLDRITVLTYHNAVLANMGPYEVTRVVPTGGGTRLARKRATITGFTV